MRSKLATAAAILAFLLAAIGAANAFTNPIVAIAALIPLVAGIGILRKRSWAAYGYALVLAAQVIDAPVLLEEASRQHVIQVVAALIFGVVVAVFFFFAGRSLAKTGAKQGTPMPWIILACVTTVPFFLVRAFTLPTASMEPTLLIGDHVLVRVFPPVHPKLGDIIAFHYVGDPRQLFIKRVVGLSGDRIHIAKGILYRNGEPVNEPYAVHRYIGSNSYLNNFPEPGYGETPSLDSKAQASEADMLDHHVSNGDVVVPHGEYFVLGDNRDNSLDSRYFGFVTPAEIIGAPFLIYESEIKPGQFRWNRTFRPI